MKGPNGYPTCDELAEARRHLLWPVFDEWVAGRVAFRGAGDRLRAWRVFLAAYLMGFESGKRHQREGVKS